MRPIAFALAFLTILSAAPLPAQTTYDTLLYNAMEYRSIGPFRGGRSAAVTGVNGHPFLYYMGGTGGGVWRTADAGNTWENISDGYFGGSIGAVAVSDWDPNVIYVGGGEKTVRGNVSHGYGMWKSTDAGRTWKSTGLTDSRHIPRIRIHPRNPDLVYAAVLGHLFGPNEERGVYRSNDGGATWERILFVSNEVGAVDLLLDPTNPRILYASMWRIKRTPHSLESGGEGSGLWKSTDSGDTWTELTENEGMPARPVGIIGVAVSPANPDRVWAQIEADEGGLFRSEDGGKKWTRVNSDRSLRQRAWYYTRVYADTQDEDVVYVLNVGFWKSKDGGKTFGRITTPHGDHHDLWISDDDPNRMIVADDGGAQITNDGGQNWSTYHNQPTAQFYRVTTDNHFPYRIYGAQQDNSTVRILHRSSSSTITERDWEPTAGGESGHIAPHPDNPDIVYGGSYGGFLSRLNHETGEERSVDVWPDEPIGHGAEDLRYRFQWNFPIFFSPHDPNTLYTAGNVLFKSMDDGQSWDPISPDLTRADSATLGSSGGPITQDNTSVEYYATIFAAIESPHEPGVLWAGSDDGLVHLSRDGGSNWTDVTPAELPEWTMINSIEVHPTEPGGLYLAGTRYKLDDFSPYLFKTTDYGVSWTRIDSGIDRQHFTRVVRADPNRDGLLYAGTESGMYVSFDDGESWSSFQLNLPVVPITDLAVKDNDLVVATQGRSFWVLDDLTPLHQLSDEVASADSWLYQPRPTYRIRGTRSEPSRTAGRNPHPGVAINYVLKETPDSSSVRLKILDDSGEEITSFTPYKEKDPSDDEKKLPAIGLEVGMNQFVWNMRYASARRFDGLVLWSDGLDGPEAVPGSYSARLIVGDDSMETLFEILPDPRSDATAEDLAAQFDFLMDIRDKLDETHRSIEDIRSVREQVDRVYEWSDKTAMADTVRAVGDTLKAALTEIEETLYQTKNQSRQDPLNYPVKLNNRLSALVWKSSMGDARPTESQVEVKQNVIGLIDEQLIELDRMMNSQLPAFNELVRQAGVPAVQVP